MMISDGFKKLTLAAIGAGAITYEKTSEILGRLVEKGEITVDQGKVINSELKHNVKESVKNQKDIVEESARKAREEAKTRRAMKDKDPDKTVDQAAAEAVDDAARAAKDVIDLVSRLSVEQIAAVRKAIDSLDHKGDEVKPETAEKEENTDHEDCEPAEENTDHEDCESAEENMNHEDCESAEKTEKMKNDEAAEPGE